MGFRYRKSINLGGGFRINLSKSGIGYSWGVKGYRVTKTARGTTRRTASIPGTGISYVHETGKNNRGNSGRGSNPANQQPVQSIDNNHYDTQNIVNNVATAMVSEGLEDMLASATGIVAQMERYKNKKNTLLEMRTDGEISKEEYKEQKEKVEKALLELTEEYERMLATEDAIQNPDICWDEIQSSLNAMIDFSNPQIDRHIIRKFVSKIVPNGRNHFRWYMNLDGKDTTTIDMVTEGRKSNAVISFNDDEEDEPPLHIGDVIGLTELQQFFPNLLKNENQNGIISNVAKCGKKSSLDAILHRLLSKKASNC